MGFDRVLLALEKAGVEIPSPTLDAFVIPIGDNMKRAAYEVLKALRDEGSLLADVDLVGRGPSKNLEFAASLGARFAVLVGEKEWEEDKVAVRNMESGEQKEISVKQLPSFLARENRV